jgi:hypothetical protein
MTNEHPKEKRQRARSPEYPALSLEQALGRAKVLYENDGLTFVPFASALKHWGYGPKSGTGLRILAALKQYGLIQEEGSGKDRKVELSKLGQEALLAPNKTAAIQKAATMPKAYQWLRGKWPAPLPSDQTMRYVLETEEGFTPGAIASLIQNYRATLIFAKLDSTPSRGDIEPSDGGKSEGPGENPAHLQPLVPPKPAGEVPMTDRQPEIRDMTIPLISGGMATLRTPWPISLDDYEHLSSWLRMMKRALTLNAATGEAESSE